MTAQAPPVTYLVHLVLLQVPNIQAYFDVVEHLDFSTEDCDFHQFFQNRTFSNLKTLKLGIAGNNKDDSLIPYLQPRLEQLHFQGGFITDKTLERLQTCCPGLKTLIIDNPLANYCTPEGLLQYVATAPSLRNLSIRCVSDVVGDSMFVTLAKTSVLRTLDFRRPITAKLIEKAVAERRRFTVWNSQLFGDLRKLVCISDYQAITRLLPHLHKLEYFEVSLKAGTNRETRARDLFPELYRLQLQLRSVVIEYLGPQPVRIDPIMMRKFVERCWKIEKLYISGKAVTGRGFLKPVIHIIKHSGSLKRLRLSMDCDLSEIVVVAAATYAGKRLIELDIGGFYDFEILKMIFSKKKFKFGNQFRFLGLGKLVQSPSPYYGNYVDVHQRAAAYAQFVLFITTALEDFNVLFPDKDEDGEDGKKGLSTMLETILNNVMRELGPEPAKDTAEDLLGPAVAIGEKTPSL